MGNSTLANYVWCFSSLCQIMYVHNCWSAICLQLKMCCSLTMKALIWSLTWNRSVSNVSLSDFVGPWYKKKKSNDLSKPLKKCAFDSNCYKGNEDMAKRYLIVWGLKISIFTVSMEWQYETFSPFYYTLLGLSWHRGNGREGQSGWGSGQSPLL